MSLHHDAAGRALHTGDVIGGTATQPYPATVIGTITALTDGAVTVQTDSTFKERHPKTGHVWTLPLSQVFYLGRQLDGRLRDLGDLLAKSGPALFYVTSMENDARTIFRIDAVAPSEQRERLLCEGLTRHALEIPERHSSVTPEIDDGPTLVYAASDKASVTRVDQTLVADDRERALCRGLLKHAHNLCLQAAPLKLRGTSAQEQQ